MYLKSIQMQNFRKYREEKNVFNFVNAKGLKRKEGTSESDIDVASATTLIVGKNNAGKTSAIEALIRLIRDSGKDKFQVSDINFYYLEECFREYKEICEKHKENICEVEFENVPYMEFVITIAIETESEDLVTNLIPFMKLKDMDNKELQIVMRYEPSEGTFFRDRMLKAVERIWKQQSENEKRGDALGEQEQFQIMLEELEKVDFQLKYYPKNVDVQDESYQKSALTEGKFKLSNLMDIKKISANNVKKDSELSDAFNTIISYRYRNMTDDEREDVQETIRNVNYDLTKDIRERHDKGINDAIGKIVSSQKMQVNLSSDLTFDKMLNNLIRYHYVENNMNIPENQFGMGYTHLVMIVAELIDYMERFPQEKYHSKINLIAIEEPESFMHPQMQELFIKNINEALNELMEKRKKILNSQLIITTHSSHILNSKIQGSNAFDEISYVYEENGKACIANLDNESIAPENNVTKREFTFLKKHVKYKVSEMFFSDAVILVEGFSEETLLPFWIEQEDGLKRHYISIFGINGAHAYLYEKLLLQLKVPTLIITDLDIKHPEKSENKDDENNKAKEFSQVESLMGRTTTNKTIKHFNKLLAQKEAGKETDDAALEQMKNCILYENIYVAYQWEINGYYATSFEEAFILTNYANELLNETLKELKPGIYNKIGVTKDNGYVENKTHSYEWQMKLSDVKGRFASEMLYKMVTAELEVELPQVPEYIKNGLKWLQEKLTGGEENGIAEN